MNTHNIYFYSEIQKIIPKSSSNSHLICFSNCPVKAAKQIRRVFGDNLKIVFYSSPQKHMLWYSLESPRRGDSNE